MPLPKEGHLGILPQGGTGTTACRRISQLEVCQLLVSGLKVAYPVGLNGCKEPIITSLPESLANGISLTGGGSIYLEINIPTTHGGRAGPEGIAPWQMLCCHYSQPL